MSFIIAIHVQEGLVFASDSRTTYTNTTTSKDGSKVQDRGVYFTDSTNKTFLTSSNVGISTCGDANIGNKPIAGFIEEFVRLHQNDDVEVIKDAILPYFDKFTTNLNTNFLIGGYTNEGNNKTQRLYRIRTASKEIQLIDTSAQGASWDGETDVLSRLITDVYIKSKTKGDYTPHTNYEILWNYLTLQDAIDFARYAVRTTIDTMRFQKRVKTVGGPIDILVIKPNSSQWISRKELG